MKCNFCKSELNDPSRPESWDCGGDCIECMAEVVDDPDCVAFMTRLRSPATREDALADYRKWIENLRK